MGSPFKEYEAKWQAHWRDQGTFHLADDIDSSKPKFYVLDSGPFATPGALGAVHLRGRVAADVVARYKRMRGHDVLFAVGWDSFRLPPHEQSVTAARHPREAAERRMARARHCLCALGISYDDEREVIAAEPATYRWTQWLFARLYERGLISQETVSMWWNPDMGVSLPEGEMPGDIADPHEHGWVRRQARAWVVSMHDYAERLLNGLDALDWPPGVVANQRDIIGRSEGWYIDFELAGIPECSIRVFTTRPDAIFGASYLALAPEHAIVDQLTTDSRRSSVAGYRTQAAARGGHECAVDPHDKTGVFTGSYAINPATSEAIPIWISDTVLARYGTGAIMGIPGQDVSDWEFAQTFELPVVRTVQPPAEFAGTAYPGEGPLINSGFLDGLSVAQAQQSVDEWLSSRGIGGREAVSRLRPWVFSRHSAWGEPIPLYHVGESASLVPDDELPVLLPEPGAFARSEEPASPLEHSTGWAEIVDRATGQLGARESATMSLFASACWRHLRHIDPKNPSAPVDRERERAFMPVDLYLCDSEYASLHLLYTRFWHEALLDAGVLGLDEPFSKLVQPGQVFMEPEDQGASVPAESHGPASPVDGSVIAKALEGYGADAVRLYLMFLGPFDQPKPWNAHGLEGPNRFLHRVARLILGEAGSASRVTDSQPTAEHLRALHTMLAAVTKDTEELRFHTAVSALMGFAHGASRWPEFPRSIAEPFVLALSPYAPHLAEEAWQQLGHERSLAHARWPELATGQSQSDTINVAVQVNGRLRASIEIPSDADECEILRLARSNAHIARYLHDKQIEREIYVPGRLVNFVIG